MNLSNPEKVSKYESEAENENNKDQLNQSKQSKLSTYSNLNPDKDTPKHISKSLSKQNFEVSNSPKSDLNEPLTKFDKIYTLNNKSQDNKVYNNNNIINNPAFQVNISIQVNNTSKNLSPHQEKIDMIKSDVKNLVDNLFHNFVLKDQEEKRESASAKSLYQDILKHSKTDRSRYKIVKNQTLFTKNFNDEIILTKNKLKDKRYSLVNNLN